MKKALQIPHLRALGSVSERAVVRCPSEAVFDGFRNDSAELLVLDSGGDLSRLRTLLVGGDRRGGRRWLHVFDRGLRQRSRHELQPLHVQAFSDLAGALRQLEGPDRVARVDDENTVALEARGPRAARDLRADGV